MYTQNKKTNNTCFSFLGKPNVFPAVVVSSCFPPFSVRAPSPLQVPCQILHLSLIPMGFGLQARQRDSGAAVWEVTAHRAGLFAFLVGVMGLYISIWLFWVQNMWTFSYVAWPKVLFFSVGFVFGLPKRFLRECWTVSLSQITFDQVFLSKLLVEQRLVKVSLFSPFADHGFPCDPAPLSTTRPWSGSQSPFKTPKALLMCKRCSLSCKRYLQTWNKTVSPMAYLR